MKRPIEGRNGPEVRIVFADIDGTLVDAGGRLSPRLTLTLEQVRASGCMLVLCTGRSRSAAARIADLLGRDGFGIVLNGAVVVDWGTGRILRRSLLPVSAVAAARDHAFSEGFSAVWLGAEERNDTIYMEERGKPWPQYELRNRSRIHYVPDLTAIPERPASIAVYGSRAGAAHIARIWRTLLGGDYTVLAGPTAVYGGWYAQLTTADATKEAAAQYLASYLAIPAAQALAIGDHENDAGLLRWAGIGVCMGDGHAAARDAADYITGTLADDGAASALERLILNQQ